MSNRFRSLFTSLMLTLMLLPACRFRPLSAGLRTEQSAVTHVVTATLWPILNHDLPANTSWLVVWFSEPVSREAVLSLAIDSGDVTFGPRWVGLDAGDQPSGAI